MPVGALICKVIRKPGGRKVSTWGKTPIRSVFYLTIGEK
jgi:hypothetical protein